MPAMRQKLGSAGALAVALLTGCFCLPTIAQSPEPARAAEKTPATITNLGQLSRVLAVRDRVECGVALEVMVCAASRPEIGVVVVQDATAVELLELGRGMPKVAAGDRIRIAGPRLWLRRRELGAQISAVPAVDNDGLHPWRPATNEITLKPGLIPVELDWFNGFRNFGLEVSWQRPNDSPQRIPAAALWHADQSQSAGGTHLLPGLRVECFQGYWERVPDFDLLQPAKVGTTPNFDLSFRAQDETVGLRFTGFIQAPAEARYSFRLTSDDGSLLFVAPSSAEVRLAGKAEPPQPKSAAIGEAMDNLQERRWLSVAGRVSFVSERGAGLELELRTGADTVKVVLADAGELNPAALLNTYVRVQGVGRAGLSASQRVILDRVYAANGADLSYCGAEREIAGATPGLMAIGQVQTMPIEEAKRAVPVHLRGVVTAANWSDRWLSLQDDTRGVFVDLHAVSNAVPASAELWEVTGHTAAGNFAPVVMADQIKGLGPAHMPAPAQPSWNELANGSMDVQWVEFQGLVSEVQSNTLDLLLPEGPLKVRLENHFPPELNGYQHAVVRIRGTLFAIWNAATREVQFGSVLMRNAIVNVDVPPPADPFNAPVKTARELLLFDAQATPFRPVKVPAQVIYADARGICAVNEGMGLRVSEAHPAELRPGDLVEAVGYPEISGPSPLLRQARVRRTGAAPMPSPLLLTKPDLVRRDLDATLVRLEGTLMAMHFEQNSPVLELKSNGHLLVARVKSARGSHLSLRPGSKLQLTGVFAVTGRQLNLPADVASFELLLNSAADLRVLSEPSWWTLERLGAAVGFLLIVLMLAAAWITQLQRQVGQRTAQLELEMRERERAEHHQALEAERSRIARDLHDDLGSSLTEIGVLASTGQRAEALPGGSNDLFDAIAGKARGSIAALDVIVWAVDPEDNSLQSLADYLSGFAGEYLSHSNIACRFKIPVTFPAVMFEGRVRHDLFLAVKETLTNIVRHSGASEVEFGIGISEAMLEIVITDNGRGFEAPKAKEGNGLKNLRSRLAKLGGSCVVESRVGAGTTVRIRLPLP